VQRAVNSSNDIFKVGEEYYLCDNAVWFVAMSTDGPWVVADSIPAAIYSIPPSSPSYHVTHVHIYESDDDTVSTGYTSGYFGVSVAFGVAMYGSGWYYPPYYGHYPHYGYPHYPYYYPYPYSYGGSAWYNPSTGMYGRSASVYGPYGGYGRAASYNPQTGAYARGGAVWDNAVWDNDEFAGRGVAYNPRTGTGIATNRYMKDNKGWGESLITHNDKWVATQSEWGKNWSTTEFETSEGGSGTIERQREGDTVYGSGEFQKGDQSLSTRSARNEQGGIVVGETGSGERGMVGRTDDGDLYAGKDGQVYRRDEDGWHQNSGDGWNKVEVPDERAAQIDQARSSASSKRDSISQSLPADRPTRAQAGLPKVMDQHVPRTVGRIAPTTARAIAVHTMAAVATNSIEVTTRDRAATSATTTAAVPARAASIARRATVQRQVGAVADHSTSTDCWIWQSGIVTRVVPSCRMAVSSTRVHGLTTTPA